MSIYPPTIKCLKCNNDIRLDYSRDKAYTNDLLALQVEMPQSLRSGSDARKNKQDIGYEGHTFIICRYCNTIISAVPGTGYLFHHAQ